MGNLLQTSQTGNRLKILVFQHSIQRTDGEGRGITVDVVSAVDIPDLLALLEAGETVVFPTARAAQALRSRHNRHQRACGLKAWKSPHVLSWGQWTEALWGRISILGLDDRVLLNSLQEEAVWSEIIAATPEGRSLNSGSLQQLAHLSRTALQLVAAHLPANELSRLQQTAETEDARAFAAWKDLFTQRCDQELFLPSSMLEDVLSKHVYLGHLPPGPSVHIAGFEQLTPAQTRLIEACRATGMAVEVGQIVHSAASAVRRAAVIASDPHKEVRLALRGIRYQCEQSPEDPPNIAVIFPDPDAERGELEPQLRQVLAPELEVVGADLSSTPWHFSSGSHLAAPPLAQQALTLLRWTQGELPIDDVGTLLLSPAFQHSDTYEVRARFEMHVLRREHRLRPQLTLPELLQLAHRSPRAVAMNVRLPELEAVNRAAGYLGVLGGKASHADWAEVVRKLLQAARWPGPSPLTASEFNTSESWEALLDLLTTLDFRSGRLTFAEFLRKLEQGAATTNVPSANPDTPIQILTLAEAEACSFDAVLILRATDTHLPAPERVHPLLGLGLQRALRLPGTDPGLAYARTLHRLRSLGERCGDLLLLSAAADENGPLRPTPLSHELGWPVVPAEDLFPDLAAEVCVEPELVQERQERLPLGSLAVQGGARVLELQAACGFRAFASLRLNAIAPESQALGMSARNRGNALHVALEAFWTEVKSQASLRALNQAERREAVQRSVRHALRRERASDPAGNHWDQAYLHLVEQRVCRLLERWLDFELERSDFTVLSPEKDELVQVGPFELKVRPDRIDRVAGGFVLVDYKTSSDLKTDHWLGERPHAPQLPLYTLLGEPDEVRGLAFAKLRPGKDMNWIGLQKEEGDLRRHRGTKVHDLGLQIGLWREELDRLAFDFADGVTDIDPKSYPNTCTFCEQRLLCRLDAVTLMAGGEEPPAEANMEEVHG